MKPTGLIVFLVSYFLISARRLTWLGFDRPAGALLGAVACVVLGVLGPGDALAAVDGATLLLLFGVMGMGAFLGLDGFFDVLEHRLARGAPSARETSGRRRGRRTAPSPLRASTPAALAAPARLSLRRLRAFSSNSEVLA